MIDTSTTVEPKLSLRTGASRKLLARKALEKAVLNDAVGPTLEQSFPSAAEVEGKAPEAEEAAATDGTLVVADENPNIGPVVAAVALQPAAPVVLPVAPQMWSAEDENSFQSLLARRKAAGYQRRGRDVSTQVLKVGNIAPNPGTVVAALVALVAERGTVNRSTLLDAMAAATFPHAKAKPQDRHWCQGYVAGAIHDGFLVLVAQPVAPTEAA